MQPCSQDTEKPNRWPCLLPTRLCSSCGCIARFGVNSRQNIRCGVQQTCRRVLECRMNAGRPDREPAQRVPECSAKHLLNMRSRLAPRICTSVRPVASNMQRHCGDRGMPQSRSTHRRETSPLASARATIASPSEAIHLRGRCR